jgi:hypothetical protein
MDQRIRHLASTRVDPDTGGLPDDLIEQLEREHGTAPLPIVMLTGFEDDAIATESLRRGANDYLVKNQEGEPYRITISSFSAALVDLTNPEAWNWIKDIIKQELISNGASGWMADFGEALADAGEGGAEARQGAGNARSNLTEADHLVPVPRPVEADVQPERGSLDGPGVQDDLPPPILDLTGFPARRAHIQHHDRPVLWNAVRPDRRGRVYSHCL